VDPASTAALATARAAAFAINNGSACVVANLHRLARTDNIICAMIGRLQMDA